MNPALWNGLDWTLAAILLASTLRAFMRGILRTIFGIAGILTGFLLGGVYCTQLARSIPWIRPASAAQIAAFLTIAGTIVVLFAIVGKMLQKGASVVGLGLFDRLFGGVFGLARGCLFGVALLMGVAVLAPQSDLIRGSSLRPYFLALTHEVSFVVPRELQQQIADGAYDLKRKSPAWMMR